MFIWIHIYFQINQIRACSVTLHRLQALQASTSYKRLPRFTVHCSLYVSLGYIIKASEFRIPVFNQFSTVKRCFFTFSPITKTFLGTRKCFSMDNVLDKANLALEFDFLCVDNLNICLNHPNQNSNVQFIRSIYLFISKAFDSITNEDPLYQPP